MNTLQALKILDKETKGRVFIVGGFVRDLLKGKSNPDLDIVIKNLPAKKIKSFLKKYGTVKEVRLSNSEIEIILFKTPKSSIEAQISLPKGGKKGIQNLQNTLKKDSEHRDFTINAFYLPINGKSVKDIIDFHQGFNDFNDKIIDTIIDPEKCIDDSPIRILRAISLSARTGFNLSIRLQIAIRKKCSLLNNVPVENIREEINKILLNDKPSTYFILMHHLGILPIILPEIDRCWGVGQDPKYHKFDVFHHCVYTADHIESDLILRLSGILHDIGKTDTREIGPDGKITFYNHELKSMQLARQIIDRFKYDNETKKQVLHLIKYHMYFYAHDCTDTVIRRFIRKVGITLDNIDNHPLFKLRKAERKGNGLKPKAVTREQINLEKRIKELIFKSQLFSLKDLQINGNVLINELGIKPSPIIGTILKYLFELVMEEPTKNEKDKLIEEARNFIKKT